MIVAACCSRSRCCVGCWLAPKGPRIAPGSALVIELEGDVRRERAEPPLVARLPRRPPRSARLAALRAAQGRARRRDSRRSCCACATSRSAGRRPRSCATRSRALRDARAAHDRLSRGRGVRRATSSTTSRARPRSCSSRAGDARAADRARRRVPVLRRTCWRSSASTFEVERVGQVQGRGRDARRATDERGAPRDGERRCSTRSTRSSSPASPRRARSRPRRCARAIDAAPSSPERAREARPDRRRRSAGTSWSTSSAAGEARRGGHEVRRASIPRASASRRSRRFALDLRQRHGHERRGIASRTGAPMLRVGDRVARRSKSRGRSRRTSGDRAAHRQPGRLARSRRSRCGARRAARAPRASRVIASFSDVRGVGRLLRRGGRRRDRRAPGEHHRLDRRVRAAAGARAGSSRSSTIGVESITRGAHADLQLSSQPLSPESTRDWLHAEVDVDLRAVRVARRRGARRSMRRAVDAVGARPRVDRRAGG